MEPLTISFRGDAQARPGRRVACNIETPDVKEIKVWQNPEDPEVFFSLEWMSPREFFAHMRTCLEDEEIFLDYPELPYLGQPMRLLYEIIPEDPTAEDDEPWPDPIWAIECAVKHPAALDFLPNMDDAEPKEGVFRAMIFVLQRVGISSIYHGS